MDRTDCIAGASQGNPERHIPKVQQGNCSAECRRRGILPSEREEVGMVETPTLWGFQNGWGWATHPILPLNYCSHWFHDTEHIWHIRARCKLSDSSGMHLEHVQNSVIWYVSLASCLRWTSFSMKIQRNWKGSSLALSTTPEEWSFHCRKCRMFWLGPSSMVYKLRILSANLRQLLILNTITRRFDTHQELQECCPCNVP